MRYLTITATAISLIFQPVVSMAQQASGQTTRIDNSEARAAADAPFSTREERLNAEPLDWDETRGEGMRTNAIQEPEDTRGANGQPSGSVAGGAPDPSANAEAETLYPEEWEGLRQLQRDFQEDLDESDGVDFGTQDIFTQYCENCSGVNEDYPQRAIGKLFSSAGTCSASVVSGQNVIVTAAHCCYNRSSGNWIGGWRFAPAYRDGFAPYGLFDWASAIVLNQWINVGDRKSDVCLIKLRNDSSGRGVTFYTGWLGRSWNHPTIQVHHSLGYPGNIGSGNRLELCVSESFNPSSNCGGASVLNTGCSMTYGASGGPWIRHYRGGGDWVNSVVSGYDSTSCTGSFGSTYNGARFTSDNIVQLCTDLGC